MLWRDRTIRYILAGVFIGVSFLTFRITVALLTHKHGHHQRPPEKLYYNGTEYFASTVILVSLDGFKPDYLKLGVTPHMDRLANEGIQADHMYSSFPTLTFPNHWTLVTGLYPEAHGIVANDFYDPSLSKTFHHSNDDSAWYSAAEPIWKTCNEHNRLSAAIMWPGSEAVLPNYLYGFNASKTPNELVDLTLELIDMPFKERPHFISVHFPHADMAGHEYGPNDPNVKSSVESLDQAIGLLMNGLEQRNIDGHAHIIVVSDHGMATTDKYIYYDDILSPTSLSYLRHREGWPLLDLRPHDDAPANATLEIYDELTSYIKQHPKDAHYQVYLKQDVPSQYHYSNNERIAPIVTIPDVGYAFLNHNKSDPTSGISQQPIGMHGYDPSHHDMLAIFMAKGPKIDRWFPPTTIPTISSGTTIPKKRQLVPFPNVEVYEFLTELLNIDGNPNNGTLKGKFLLQK
ncbi:alkaline-phosphatase-like protein [Chlamydoabsidia padenii]|nr:alkaline-phosphatase-like protein [Chlamydoabsidia padenii]